MRFIAQIGKQKYNYKQKRTKFVEAERDFAEYLGAWNKEQKKERLIKQRVRWKFNPPATPHFRGVWEPLVRNCKKAMYVVLGNRSVTEDVLSTTMCFVEQSLNPKPLTPIS